MIELTPNNFDEETANGAVLVDFWSPTCAPCRRLAAVLEQIDEAVGELKVCKVNIMDAVELARSHDVNALPTLIYFINGVEKTRIIGFYARDEIIDRLDAASRDPDFS